MRSYAPVADLGTRFSSILSLLFQQLEFSVKWPCVSMYNMHLQKETQRVIQKRRTSLGYTTTPSRQPLCPHADVVAQRDKDNCPSNNAGKGAIKQDIFRWTQYSWALLVPESSTYLWLLWSRGSVCRGSRPSGTVLVIVSSMWGVYLETQTTLKGAAWPWRRKKVSRRVGTTLTMRVDRQINKIND